jgi:hypothetical protein
VVVVVAAAEVDLVTAEVAVVAVVVASVAVAEVVPSSREPRSLSTKCGIRGLLKFGFV